MCWMLLPYRRQPFSPTNMEMHLVCCCWSYWWCWWWSRCFTHRWCGKDLAICKWINTSWEGSLSWLLTLMNLGVLSSSCKCHSHRPHSPSLYAQLYVRQVRPICFIHHFCLRAHDTMGAWQWYHFDFSFCVFSSSYTCDVKQIGRGHLKRWLNMKQQQQQQHKKQPRSRSCSDLFLVGD